MRRLLYLHNGCAVDNGYYLSAGMYKKDCRVRKSPHSAMQAIDMNAISSVISFLTDALIPFCSPIMVQKIRFQLMTSLRSVQSLSLIPYAHPPRPMYDACLITGLPWAQWMLLLGNQPIHIIITPLHVYAHVSTRMIALWEADADLRTNEYSFHRPPATFGETQTMRSRSSTHSYTHPS